MPPSVKKKLPILLLLLATLIAYLPAIRSGGFIWDDDVHITQNQNLRSVDGLAKIWFAPYSSPQYYPVAHTLWWMEYHLWGLWPPGYHAVNVFLHAANVVLLWLILRRLKIRGALLASLLFAVHPLEVETVAWVMEGKTLLSTFFYLVAFASFYRFLSQDTPEPASPPRWRFYALGMVCFLLALLSKSVAATLPAALLLVLWWKTGRCRVRHLLLMLPPLILGGLSGLYTAFLEKHHVGAVGAEWALTPLDRPLVAGRDVWFYAGKLAWPHPLIFFYPRWTIDSHAVWQYSFPLALVALLALLWVLRNRIGRGPLAAVLFFIGTLFPALGFLDFYPMRYSFVADHFQYLAGVGLLVLAAGVFARLAQRIKWPRQVTVSLSVIVLGALLSLTFARCFAYRDSLTLYQDIVAKNPDSWGGHALLASVYQSRGDYPDAALHYQRAATLAPQVLENREGLGAALLGEGEVDRAQKLLEEVLQEDPSRAKAYNDLAGVYVRSHDSARAAELYRQALALAPSLSEAAFNLGTLYAQAGQFRPASDAFALALKDRPDWPEAALALGRCLASDGQFRAARPYFALAVQLRPSWPDARQDLARLDRVLQRVP